MTSRATPLGEATFGDMLRAWRKRRRYTQLDLSIEAEISTRHLSFLETGRAKPSREMVLIVASVLEVPLAERNAMLNAAGFAAVYRSEGLEAKDAAPIQHALRFLLQRTQPYPAVVVDPGWNVVMSNDAYVRIAGWLTGHDTPNGDAETIHETPPIRGSNLLIPMFADPGVRAALTNFDQIASLLLGHLRRTARDDDTAKATLEVIDSLDTMPPSGPVDIALPLVVPTTIDLHGVHLSLFTSMTMLGTATDTVLSSLRLETFFPADDASDTALTKITNP